MSRIAEILITTQTDLGVTLRIPQRSGTTVRFQTVVWTVISLPDMVMSWLLSMARVLNNPFPNRKTKMRLAGNKTKTLLWPDCRRMHLQSSLLALADQSQNQVGISKNFWTYYTNDVLHLLYCTVCLHCVNFNCVPAPVCTSVEEL